ncbi:hypothetical protein [Catenovulum sediminis]|uniref:Primosomal protein N' 3' DNA-binding domain-containing protein n=1 Tax=Catenovulum sediminis TaxID=1740262 RepID=A0ABV1RMG5_9ALTE
MSLSAIKYIQLGKTNCLFHMPLFFKWQIKIGDTVLAINATGELCAGKVARICEDSEHQTYVQIENAYFNSTLAWFKLQKVKKQYNLRLFT